MRESECVCVREREREKERKRVSQTEHFLGTGRYAYKPRIVLCIQAQDLDIQAQNGVCPIASKNNFVATNPQDGIKSSLSIFDLYHTSPDSSEYQYKSRAENRRFHKKHSSFKNLVPIKITAP